MDKMWAGRFSKALDKQADDFNSSIHFDSRMYKQDIIGSIVHAKMLGDRGIIADDEKAQIIKALGEILEDIENGDLEIDMNAEDIHMFIEAQLTERIGEAGKKLHTARSRNDQVALDIRMYLMAECEEIGGLLKALIRAVRDLASENKATIMPGYTHLQRAQPITFAHHILAYGMMFARDLNRLGDASKRMYEGCPIGSCALAGTTYNTDREWEAERLGFSGISLNSIDGVSDRDFCIELLSCFATIMMHLSRFSEEIILWSSWEFKFVELDDSYTTGSSIMPQKKNPDMAELVRGKTGRVYGDLMALLTTLKGLPLAYNKDMQEDKEAIFDAVDTVKKCVSIFTPMIATMKPIPENMLAAAGRGFINATDLADYLVKKGMPFRTAYKIVGEIVAYCIENGLILETLPIEKYKEFDGSFDTDLYNEISLKICVEKRISAGGTGEKSVMAQIDFLTELLND